MNRRNFLFASAAVLACTGRESEGQEQMNGGFDGWWKVELGHPMPDPFCIRWQGAYYIIGTHHGAGESPNGRLYDMYRSEDLRAWTHLGGILERPEYEGSDNANYWAPEIMAHGGMFYLYYTADSDRDGSRRYVRLGVADRIEGPYVDQGIRMTEQASIDANPNWMGDHGWMFYTGNDNSEHEGQVMVDRMISPTKMARRPVRAFPDERVGWEEGAFMVARDGRCYLFTSMGNWRDGTYHVMLSVAAKPEGPYTRIMDGNEPLVILRSYGNQLGTGHNSVFEGPGGRLYICFHAWDPENTGRYPFIAPLRFESGRFHVVL